MLCYNHTVYLHYVTWIGSLHCVSALLELLNYIAL